MTNLTLILTMLICWPGFFYPTHLDSAALSEPSASLDQRLQHELARRTAEDQSARRKLVELEAMLASAADPQQSAERDRLAAHVTQIDRDNLAWLKKVVEEYGWPGASLVGTDGAQHAWLLVQHADGDRDFQGDCLKRMQALPAGEVTPQHIAYLTDRILVGRGKKQKYGTQAKVVDGKIVMLPIENPDEVDKLRHELGLEPLAEYVKSLEELYAPKPTE